MLAISEDYELSIRQGPVRARVAGVKEKDRKPVDPPPIIQLKIKDDSDPAQNYLQSPYYFMCCNLYDASQERPAQIAPQTALAGTLVSSLHRLKDVDNSDGGFFVFGDLSVKVEGDYRLRFSLFEMRKAEVFHIKSIISNPFTVFAAKNFPGMSESTFLSRSFGDQGVRLRIRKEPRTLVKRPAPPGLRPEDYPRPYPPQPHIDPRTSMSQIAQAHVGSYITSPSQEHNLVWGDPSVKRSRTSIDLGPTDHYVRDARFTQRIYHEQQPPYSAYPPQQHHHPNYAINQPHGPHSAPAGMPDYSFRHTNPGSSATSSPYNSPGPQITGRPLVGTAPPYQQHTRYSQYPYPQNHQRPQTPVSVPHHAEPTPSLRLQQLHSYPSNYPTGPPLQSPNTYPIPSAGLSRTSVAQPTYPTYPPPGISPGGTMAPPQFGQQQQQQQPFNLLPPLQTSAAQVQPGFAIIGPSSYSAPAAPGSSLPQSQLASRERYSTHPGPPTSFDTAAQRQTQPG
ncbi:MAG: hypothetical protein M1830_002030 [Pleopsidium flavum]|nr:MAG: hypothetical protein M1830_002030 [Pleopsidium flavum]